MNSVLKKLAGQTAIYGLTTMLARFINYLLLPIHTAVFLPSDYGIISALYAYISILTVVFTYGMETGFFRFATKNPDKAVVYSTAQLSLVFSSVLLATLISLFAKSIASFIELKNHSEFVICFAWILAIDAIAAIPFARLRIENRPVKYGLIKLLNVLINVGLTVWFLLIAPRLQNNAWFTKLDQHDVVYVFISNLAASAVTLIVALLVVRRVRLKGAKEEKTTEGEIKHPEKGRFIFDYITWKKMIAYSWPLIIVGLAGMVNETLDRVLILKLWPGSSEEKFTQVGIYSASYKISILITLFIQAYRMAAEPFFFNESDKADAKKMYSRTMNYFVIACCTIYLLVMCFLEYFKLFLRDESYYPGLKVVPILLLANICLGVYYNLTIWYKLTDKTFFGSLIALMGALITLVSNTLLIPRIGYMGAAYTTLICYSVMMVVSYVAGQKYYPVNYNMRKFFAYLGVTLLIGWCMNPFFYGLYEKSQPIYIISGSLTLLGFLGFVFLLEREKRNSAS